MLTPASVGRTGWSTGIASSRRRDHNTICSRETSGLRNPHLVHPSPSRLRASLDRFLRGSGHAFVARQRRHLGSPYEIVSQPAKTVPGIPTASYAPGSDWRRTVTQVHIGSGVAPHKPVATAARVGRGARRGPGHPLLTWPGPDVPLSLRKVFTRLSPADSVVELLAEAAKAIDDHKGRPTGRTQGNRLDASSTTRA